MITVDADPDVDYITILDAQAGRKIVVIMRYHKRDDQYVQGKCSMVCTPPEAERLAELWVAATGLSVR